VDLPDDEDGGALRPGGLREEAELAVELLVSREGHTGVPRLQAVGAGYGVHRDGHPPVRQTVQTLDHLRLLREVPWPPDEEPLQQGVVATRHLGEALCGELLVGVNIVELGPGVVPQVVQSAG
jgi:hypothetical protein